MKVRFPPKLAPLFVRGRYRYKVGKGGRGSAKSWGFARALLTLASQEKLLVLCAREFQNSITESVHRLLDEQIDQLGLRHFYRVQETSIRGLNGSEFIFAGIRTNPQKIKGTEGADVLWIEEAETVSKRSWEIVIPTIRKPGSEIWVTYNPQENEDPTQLMFGTPSKYPDGSCVMELNWTDNPWFPDVLRREMEYLYRVDPETAEHVWGGQTRKASAAQIMRGKFEVRSFTPVTEGPCAWDGPYFGLDFGFSTDPLAGVKLWIAGRTLYHEHETGGHEVENDDIAPLLLRELPGVDQAVLRCDNSRPETISYLRKRGGLRARPAKKWEGSVEDGLTYLKSFEQIVLHPRCKRTLQEYRNYKYKVDRLSGDILRDIVDANNHWIDATRYALDPMIKTKTSIYED